MLYRNCKLDTCVHFFVEIQIPSHQLCIDVKHTMTESPTTANYIFIKTCTRVSKPSTNKSCLSELLQNTILETRVHVLIKYHLAVVGDSVIVCFTLIQRRCDGI